MTHHGTGIPQRRAQAGWVSPTQALAAYGGGDEHDAVRCAHGPAAGALPSAAALRVSDGIRALCVAAIAGTAVLVLASRLAPPQAAALVGAPGAEPERGKIAQAARDASRRGDRWLICLYDALARQGGAGDGPGYQRADPACQRR